MVRKLGSTVTASVAVAALLVGCTGVDRTGADTSELRGPTASRTGAAEPAPSPSDAHPATTAPTKVAPSDRTTSAASPDSTTSAVATDRGSSAMPTDPPPSAAPAEAMPQSAAADTARLHSHGQPRRAALSIPALGLHDLLVVPYQGWTDDAPGTAIQNRGRAASPYGPHGGVGPGGIGNYQVTAHRTSSTRAFEFLPDLQRGGRVIVETRKARYVYRIERTRETSFRSARSLAEQRAAVPGRPSAVATRAFITLSTCATPEDHAAGNYWSDEFDNPEHRIDKIGVLVRSVSLDR